MKMLALVFVLLVPATAMADEWGLGLRALSERVNPSDGGPGGIDMGGAGILVRWRISALVGLELGIDGVHGQLDGYDRKTSSATLAATVHLNPESRWDIYLLAGIGGATDKITAVDADGMTVEDELKETLLRVGGGVEFRWEHIGVGAELAGVAFFLQNPETSSGLVPSKSGGGQLSLFGTFYF